MVDYESGARAHQSGENFDNAIVEELSKNVALTVRLHSNERDTFLFSRMIEAKSDIQN